MMFRVRTLSTGVAGSPYYTNIYYVADGGGTAQGCADRVRLFWDSMRLKHTTLIRHQVESDVAVVNPVDGSIQDIQGVTVAPVVGGESPEILPTMTQGLIRINTAGIVRGRRVQGRIFVPGWTELSNSNGAPSGDGMAAAAALLEDPGTSAKVCVWSRPLDLGLGIEAPGSQHPSTSFARRPFWAVLRSRRD